MNAEHTITIHKRMLSRCLWSVLFWCVFLCVYTEHMRALCIRMLSACVQIVCICLAHMYFRRNRESRSKEIISGHRISSPDSTEWWTTRVKNLMLEHLYVGLMFECTKNRLPRLHAVNLDIKDLGSIDSNNEIFLFSLRQISIQRITNHARIKAIPGALNPRNEQQYQNVHNSSNSESNSKSVQTSCKGKA